MSFQEHPRGGASGIRSHPESRQLHFCLEHRHRAPPGHGALRSSPSGGGEDEEAGGRGAGEDIAAIAYREVKNKKRNKRESRYNFSRSRSNYHTSIVLLNHCSHLCNRRFLSVTDHSCTGNIRLSVSNIFQKVFLVRAYTFIYFYLSVVCLHPQA